MNEHFDPSRRDEQKNHPDFAFKGPDDLGMCDRDVPQLANLTCTYMSLEMERLFPQPRRLVYMDIK